MNQARRIWLYLPVEVKVRELDAKLLFAYYALKRGYRVVIGEHKMVELAAQYYPTGIFFSKGYPKSFRKRIISSANDHGHEIVELDEEGLMVHDKTDYLNNRMQIDVLQSVTQEYCWGDYQKEMITPNLNHANVDGFITGNPRFDLLTPKYHPLFIDEVCRLERKYKSFILVNTRFSKYNSILGKKETDEHALYIKSLYEHFLKMIHHIAHNFPERQIIIRPHPGEDASSYVREFSQFPNVHIIREGNIVKWLLASSVIIHHGCTTSVEAFLLNKPIISYMPTTSRKFDLDLPNRLGIKATNIADLNQLLLNPSSLILTTKQRNALIRYVNQYCKWSPTYYAYETILNLLDEICDARPKSYPRIRKTLYRKNHKHIQHFFPYLNVKEIQTFFEKIAHIENDEHRFIIKSLGINLFCIE